MGKTERMLIKILFVVKFCTALKCYQCNTQLENGGVSFGDQNCLNDVKQVPSYTCEDWASGCYTRYKKAEKIYGTGDNQTTSTLQVVDRGCTSPETTENCYDDGFWDNIPIWTCRAICKSDSCNDYLPEIRGSSVMAYPSLLLRFFALFILRINF